MKYKNILVTGGAGFVGSNFSLKLKKDYPEARIVVLDNLKRRGAELNLSRFKEVGVEFQHGDIRNKEDLEVGDIDLVLECSAEPSVMAGITSSPSYLINTNLIGAINCFELARQKKADVIFLSTSRVYPIEAINNLKFIEEETRFSLASEQSVPGVSEKGINENFSLVGARSLYGATKLASELILQEYVDLYGIRGVINRCGVITGPWQFGKVDQGVMVLWLARHIFQKDLNYIGFGGTGKQVRDFIHADDLYELVKIQLNEVEKHNGKVYNVGGGSANSLSLQEMTKLCQEITGNQIKINSIKDTRQADIRSYVTDYTSITELTGWRPKKDARTTFTEIYQWICDYREELIKILD